MMASKRDVPASWEVAVETYLSCHDEQGRRGQQCWTYPFVVSAVWLGIAGLMALLINFRLGGVQMVLVGFPIPALLFGMGWCWRKAYASLIGYLEASRLGLEIRRCYKGIDGEINRRGGEDPPEGKWLAYTIWRTFYRPTRWGFSFLFTVPWMAAGLTALLFLEAGVAKLNWLTAGLIFAYASVCVFLGHVVMFSRLLARGKGKLSQRSRRVLDFFS